MSKADSITLWKSRIQSRKLSGLKVNDWCKQNSISRDSYYYWHSKSKDIKKEQDDVFVEVLPAPAPLIPVGKVTEPKITIAWLPGIKIIDVANVCNCVSVKGSAI